MVPSPGEVLHFSEDPAIRRFLPHVARTAQQPEPDVWACDARIAPSYWFPRDCPRAMAWVVDGFTTDADHTRLLGPHRPHRVHLIEAGWVTQMQSTSLFAYRFAATDFVPLGDPHPHAMVASTEVVPLGPAEPVGDLLSLHGRAGIELRPVPNLWSWWDSVVGSTCGHSGIRLANALPRPE